MGKERIELSQYCYHWILSPTRLPVPPFALFFLCLKIKYVNTKKYLLYLLPAIIFISPYFRSSSIWVGPENLSLIFFLASVYFFLRHENEKQNLSFILLNVFFLAIAAYIRPIYSLFSHIFFFKILL